MKLYAQHGWGKVDKIERGLKEVKLDGVILSPHDERPEEMIQFAQNLSASFEGLDLMLDPQVYVSLLRDPNEGKLPLYPFYSSDLSLRDFTPRSIQKLVRGVIDFQRNLPVTAILTPTIIQNGFTDQSSQVAHSLAQESIEYWGSLSGERRPILISTAFSELALAAHDDVGEFLDTISLYDAAGFYLIVDRADPIYSQGFESSRLLQLMRIVYALTRSRFRIICGYSDFLSVMLGAAGAYAGATGWSQKLRRFNRGRFLPSRGGRQPRERYSSLPLLNSIYLTELDACQDVGRLRTVKSNTSYDRVFDGHSYPSGVSWPTSENILHHWATLARLHRTISMSETSDRVQGLRVMIANAEAIYGDLVSRDVRFEVPNGPNHLSNWGDSLEMFSRKFKV